MVQTIVRGKLMGVLYPQEEWMTDAQLCRELFAFDPFTWRGPHKLKSDVPLRIAVCIL
jgi:hypothetical protein